jgi:hypothetical protein
LFVIFLFKLCYYQKSRVKNIQILFKKIQPPMTEGQADQTKETKTIAGLEKFIDQDLVMMVEEEWTAAIDHFEDEQAADAIGWSLNVSEITARDVLTEQAVNDAFKICALHSGGGQVGNIGVVSENRIRIVAVHLPKEIKRQSPPDLVTRLFQNDALLHAE